MHVLNTRTLCTLSKEWCKGNHSKQSWKLALSSTFAPYIAHQQIQKLYIANSTLAFTYRILTIFFVSITVDLQYCISFRYTT